MDVTRLFWEQKLLQAWKKSPIVWLAGVRRSGKTTLSKGLKGGLYLNCDLPSVRAELVNPEAFFKNTGSKFYIFDEIHQLPEASQLLKIGADTIKNIRILATGSSTLVAGKKFKDTLTGRKRNVRFLPVLISELEAFGVSLKKRVAQGGLPQALLSQELDSEFYAEWLDSYYARDIQELFSVEKKQPFLKALEYLLALNGCQLEVTELAKVAGISRPTVIKYLEIFEITQVISLVRPFSENPVQEIVSQPKVYGFDTGFVNHVNGVKTPSPSESGKLLENLVFETLQAMALFGEIRYWRTKTQKEIDFVLPLESDRFLALECKWSERSFKADHLESFRKFYPQGENWVVTQDSVTRTEKISSKMSVRFIHLLDLQREIERHFSKK